MAEASRGTTQAGEAGEQAPSMVEIRQLVKQFGKVRAVPPRKGFGGVVEKCAFAHFSTLPESK